MKVLIALLVVLLGFTVVSERAARPPETGDEPTYALQAASLAWDFDLRYGDEDFARYREQWGARPPGIDLESRDGGETQVYGRPFFHALVSAPFVRLMPQRGMRIANALLLAAAALLAAWALQRPLWVAVFVFASVTFLQVFEATADVFLLAVTAAGFALIYAGQKEKALPSMYEGESTWRGFGRWLAAGALLAIPGTYHLLYLFLLLPAAAAKKTRGGWAGLLVGSLGMLALAFSVHAAAGGDPLLVPSLDFEADPALLLWNSVYFLVGRHVGILPYFLPVILVFMAARSDRWVIGAAVALAVLGTLVARPYDFASISFLPLYAALWFVAAKPLRPAAPVAIALLAVPFVAPIPPSVQERIKSFLPYEATQQELPGEWLSQGSLRIKPTSPNVWRASGGRDFRIAGKAHGEVVIASPSPLERLQMTFDRNAPTLLQVNGQDLRPVALGADGSVTFEVPLGSGRTHPMWWTGGTHHLYNLRLRLPDAPVKPIAFQVR